MCEITAIFIEIFNETLLVPVRIVLFSAANRLYKTDTIMELKDTVRLF